jgi:hypothetical protein
MFVITIATCYNITAHILEIRADKNRKEKNARIAVVVASTLAGLFAIVLAVAGIVKYIKHIKKGYLLDFFDTEAYDVFEPDEEVPAESIIKSELSGTDDPAIHEELNSNHIPLDEEASEDDYN